MKFFSKILFSLSVLIFTTIASASIAVIGNAQIPIDHLNKQEVVDLYLGKPVNLPVTLVPYDQLSTSALYSDFYRDLLNWSPSQVNSYWASLIFSGVSNPPQQLYSQVQALAAVKQDPQVIAYVDDVLAKKFHQDIRILYLVQSPGEAASAQVKINTAKTSMTAHKASSEDYLSAQPVKKNQIEAIQALESRTIVPQKNVSSHANTVTQVKSKINTTQAKTSTPLVSTSEIKIAEGQSVAQSKSEQTSPSFFTKLESDLHSYFSSNKTSENAAKNIGETTAAVSAKTTSTVSTVASSATSKVSAEKTEPVEKITSAKSIITRQEKIKAPEKKLQFQKNTNQKIKPKVNSPAPQKTQIVPTGLSVSPTKPTQSAASSKPVSVKKMQQSKPIPAKLSVPEAGLSTAGAVQKTSMGLSTAAAVQTIPSGISQSLLVVQKPAGLSAVPIKKNLVTVSSTQTFQQPQLKIEALQNPQMLNTPKVQTPAAQLQPAPLIWNALRSHFAFGQYVDQPAVQYSIQWFLNHRDLLNKILSNAQPYLYYVFQQTQQYHMPAELALVPMIESGYDPFAYSSKGATGIWQMMPTTAASFGLTMDWWYDARRDTIASTQYALNYLNQLHTDFHDWLLAMAAYDAGQGAIEQAIQYNQNLGKATDFWSLPLAYETKSYVPKLLALAAIIANPDAYHVQLPAIADASYFSVIPLPSQITLTQAAQLADVSESVIQQLNPGLRRWATESGQAYDLLIPMSSAKDFKEHMKVLFGHEQVTWTYHEVRVGDTLQNIAENYHTTVNVLQKANGLKSEESVSVGEGILVPLWLHHKFGESQTVRIVLPNSEAAEALRANSSQQDENDNLGQQIRKDDSLKTILNKLYPSQA